MEPSLEITLKGGNTAGDFAMERGANFHTVHWDRGWHDYHDAPGFQCWFMIEPPDDYRAPRRWLKCFWRRPFRVRR